jgi:serine/threonine-protein kinase HipA
MVRPADAARIDTADVYKGDGLVGALTRSSGDVEFTYSPLYLEGEGPAIASSLLRRAAPYRRSGGAVPPFFAGLLPEGARLVAVVRADKTSADDELSLLLAVGSDTVGDVRIVPHGEAPDSQQNDLPSDPRQIRFADLLRATVDPDADSLDSAIPGVQDKISDAMISFPLRRGRSWTILKLDPARFPLITHNEHFFLSMARSAGFRVPHHEIITDAEGASGLLVERFDRTLTDDGSARRIAQEDACQFLGRYPADKYRVTVNDIAAQLEGLATSPKAAVLDLVMQAAFAWMIGNGDFHAKNYSLQWRPDGIVAATPLYDVVSTLPYPLRQNMAMDLDGRDANFRLSSFVMFAERFNVPERLISRKLREMIDRSKGYLDDLESIGYGPDTTQRLHSEISSRMDDLAST